MKIISWNINGIRAIEKKGFIDIYNKINADIFCIQEIKCDLNNIPESIKNCCSYTYFFPALKNGYSGVGILSKIKPNKVIYGLGNDQLDNEGRSILIEFDDFTLINLYFPNGSSSIERESFKSTFNDFFYEYLKNIKQKNIFFCGDLNIAHKEIDIFNPSKFRKTSGFLDSERKWLDKIIELNYIDSFRLFNQNENNYTWWDYRTSSRTKNEGWRIDYIFANQSASKKIISSYILNNIEGSDHCPVGIDIII